jgi:hypothetical protein
LLRLQDLRSNSNAATEILAKLSPMFKSAELF